MCVIGFEMLIRVSFCYRDLRRGHSCHHDCSVFMLFFSTPLALFFQRTGQNGEHRYYSRDFYKIHGYTSMIGYVTIYGDISNPRLMCYNIWICLQSNLHYSTFHNCITIFDTQHMIFHVNCKYNFIASTYASENFEPKQGDAIMEG